MSVAGWSELVLELWIHNTLADRGLVCVNAQITRDVTALGCPRVITSVLAVLYSLLQADQGGFEQFLRRAVLGEVAHGACVEHACWIRRFCMPGQHDHARATA